MIKLHHDLKIFCKQCAGTKLNLISFHANPTTGTECTEQFFTILWMCPACGIAVETIDIYKEE
jgi:hypothetical protein